MSSSRSTLGESVASRQETPSTGSASAPSISADAYADWLDRVQRSRARHAAITRNLYTWSNYKNWADRMKSSWDDEPEK